MRRSRDHRDASADQADAPPPSPRLPPDAVLGSGHGSLRLGRGAVRFGAGRRRPRAVARRGGGPQRRPRRGGGGPAVLVPAWRDAEAGRTLQGRRRNGFRGRRRRRRVGPRVGRRLAGRHPSAGPVPRRHRPGARSVLGRRGALRTPVTTQPARKAAAGISESLISAGCGRICRAYQERRLNCAGSPGVGRGGGFPPAGNPPPSPGEGTDRR